MITGIYCLRFKGTNQIYIGKAKNINQRFSIHKQTLKNNTAAKKLQQAYNTYGIPLLEIILECTEEDLSENEIAAIEVYDSYNNGFNSTKGGECGSWEGLSGVSNPGSLYSREQLLQCFELLLKTPVISNTTISEITGVSKHVIINISCCRGHTWLKKEFPEKYKELEQLKGNRYTAKSRGKIYPNIRSPKGIVFSVDNAKKFSEEHRITNTHLCKLLNGKARSVDGWTLV